MILFWSIVILMLLLALALLIKPLVHKGDNAEGVLRNKVNIVIHKQHLLELQNDREKGIIDQETFEQSMQELEQDLLMDVGKNGIKENTGNIKHPARSIIFIAFILPVFVVLLYLVLGNIKLISSGNEEIISQAQPDEMHSIEKMVNQLRNRLEMQADDGEGWYLLGRSYIAMNRYKDATSAYRMARNVLGDEPDLLADLSESLILSNNHQVTEEISELVKLALNLDPDQPKALWIAGYVAYTQGKAVDSLQYWERLLVQLSADSQEAFELRKQIAEIKQNTDLPVIAGSNVNSQVSIDVQVNLDAALSGKVKPEDVVFIYAQAATGPHMPLAIERRFARDLPVNVTLNDSMGMTPEFRLSNFKKIRLFARISKSGKAISKPGDLQGISDIVSTGEVNTVKITIDQVIQ